MSSYEYRIPPSLPFGVSDFYHRRMARVGHGIPKVSSGPAMPHLSTPCGRATPETPLRPFLGWPSRRAGGLWPYSTLLDTPGRTPLPSLPFGVSDWTPLLLFRPGPLCRAGDRRRFRRRRQMSKASATVRQTMLRNIITNQ
jgi:hypothetical protein